MNTTIERPEATEAPEFVLPNPNLMEVDGFIIDLETGEIVSGAEVPQASDIPEAFIEGLIRKLNRLDSRAASARASGIEALRSKQALVDEALAKLRATPEFMELGAVELASVRLQERNEKAADAIRMHFEGTFRAFAATELGKGKERTWRSPFGSISLRKLQPEITLPETQDASWLERLYAVLPSAIKQTVALKPLRDGLKDAAMAADLEGLDIKLKEQPDKVEVVSAFKAGSK